jgi:hypothetical protein
MQKIMKELVDFCDAIVWTILLMARVIIIVGLI